MDLREQSKQKLVEAYELMKQAGTPEQFINLAEDTVEWKELEDNKQGEDWSITVFQCSLCGTDHRMEFTVSKSKQHSWQEVLTIDLSEDYCGWSLWERLKNAGRFFKNIVIEKKFSYGISITGTEITKLKDLLKRLP